jgi:hypothetical protein
MEVNLMERTWKPTTAGILTMISGCYGVGMGAWVIAWGGVMTPLAELGGVYALPGNSAIGIGIVALIGGIYALRRKVWWLVLTGAILALPLFPIGTVLGIPAIIFVSQGKKEFD